MAKGHSSTNLELYIQVTGLKIRKMELVRTSGQMVLNMREAIKKATSMVKVYSPTRMVTHTMENFFKINFKAKEHSPGRVLERSIAENGRITKCTVKDI